MDLGRRLASGSVGLFMLSCVGNISTSARSSDAVGAGSVANDDAGPADGNDPALGSVNQQSSPATTGSTAGVGSGSPTWATNSPPTQDPPVVPIVHDCNGLAAEGVFEEITPPEVKAGIGQVRDGGGTFAIAVDPVNQGTLYAGSLFQKVWKSTDCGATWKHISTGRNGSLVDSGMNWTFAIDPQAPETVYTNSGYGSNSLYKSTNGGVDWDEVWPPASQPDLARAFQYNFANVIALDPKNHLHILLTFHEPCLAPHTATCIAESMNGGATWRLIDGRPGWDGNEGQVIFFLDSSTSWLWGSQSNGFWRSGDSGTSWEAIAGMTTSHLQGSQLLRTTAGVFYVAGADGIWRSPDGAAATWKLVPGTGPIVGGLLTNGSTMFANTCYFANYCQSRYLRSPESDGQQWTVMNSPNLAHGGTTGYDPGHHLLYSSNMGSGLWRIVAH